MAREGASIGEISSAIGRSVEVVTKVLVRGKNTPKRPARSKPTKRSQATTRKAGRAAKPTATREKAAPASSVAKDRGVVRNGLLQHRFWLRSGLSVKLSLPADLRADEAERLAELVRNLPFSS